MLGKRIKLRRAWRINPVTRVKKSEKTYSRQKIKLETKRIINGKE
ncbi:MAG: hypothetical protein NTW13_02740 [Candidatus Omnitrophica bacterium]|nr:hypothetical protein [Candidatus Omnitrophota bacterium]